MRPSTAIAKLLQQLLKRTQRQSKSLDKYHVRFLKNLQSASTPEAEDALFNEYNQLLEGIPSEVEDKLSEGRLLSRQSLSQLQQITSLSAPLKSKLKKVDEANEPYTISEHHAALEELIKIYQHVVIDIAIKSTNQATENKAEVELVSDQLQLIILELDVVETYAEKLNQVRELIANERDFFKLPGYCLQVINIIVDSSREERRTSRQFLYTLNDGLTQFYLKFAKTLKSSEADHEEQKQVLFNLQKEAELLKEDSEKKQTLESLRNYIVGYVTNVQSVVAEQSEQQEEKFRCKYKGLVRQIKELQNETQEYQKALSQQSKQLHMDFLTKIPNRAAWSERLENEVNHFKRYNTALNIAIIDIDKFKKINDSYGHLAGDKVLSVVAQALQKSLRSTDYIARFGGEEFALLLPEISQEQATITLDKLRNLMKTIPFQFKKEDLSITISIGFTAFHQSDRADDAFERADSALYLAKKNGRDQVVFVEAKEI